MTARLDYMTRIKRIAKKYGCTVINEDELQVGDEFRLFANTLERCASVDTTIFIWDGTDGGVGWGHEKVSGRKAMFTGEDYVAVERKRKK